MTTYDFLCEKLEQFARIEQAVRDIVYAIKSPEHMLFDLDSTLLNTYGHQEGEAFNYHYQAHGYHPLLCFDGITGDLLKMELRDGTHYCSKDADKFMIPLLKEYRTKYPSLPLYLRGGSGLSGGQRQRLLIARAICKKPGILIFDEATSALDNITQKHVSDSLDALKCTRIVVAHRLSTIKNCDRIICLDEGRIVEEGTYDELMEKKGFFEEIVSKQQLDK